MLGQLLLRRRRRGMEVMGSQGVRQLRVQTQEAEKRGRRTWLRDSSSCVARLWQGWFPCTLNTFMRQQATAAHECSSLTSLYLSPPPSLPSSLPPFLSLSAPDAVKPFPPPSTPRLAPAPRPKSFPSSLSLAVTCTRSAAPHLSSATPAPRPPARPHIHCTPPFPVRIPGIPPFTPSPTSEYRAGDSGPPCTMSTNVRWARRGYRCPFSRDVGHKPDCLAKT